MNPWVILAAVLFFFASLFGVGKWQNKVGHETERAAWLEKDNAALTQANATIERLNREARASEQKTASTIATMGEQHAKAIEALEVRRRRDVVAARDGSIKLRVAGACPASPGRGGAAEAAAAPGVGDGAASIELPREVTADLLALANDADQVADQLTSCQSVVRAYFGAVNGVPLPVVPNFKLENSL